VERRLTAILCADVHGYSRLMGEDEEATVRTLSAHRKIIDRLIEQHHGKFVNSAGDSVLAEFASVVNAVKCAIEIQTALGAANAPLSNERRMNFRIGVNLGDVIVDGEQIYGDGVNVAARLESLAQPGGINISGSVYEQIRNKLALNYEDLGAQRVKNIAEPVRVFRVLADAGATTTRRPQIVQRKYLRRGVFSIAGLATIVAIVVLVQHVSLRPPHTAASIPPAQGPDLALPDKPSIAVLPFANISGDHEQEYFSDGITDDLITDLSRLPGLFVIARSSSFTYKGKPARLQDVGRQLGVKYVLQGSVRKSGEQVRITVQLADATNGTELWAERYDRPLRDVFAVQDEIVQRIVKTLDLQLSLAKQGYIFSRSTDNLEAYDDFLRGMEYLLTFTTESNTKARQMFEKAIDLDPKYAMAYAALGENYYLGWAEAYNKEPDSIARALRAEQQAVALDDSLSYPHSVLAYIYMVTGQYDQGITEAQRGIALDPNSASAYRALADVLNGRVNPAAALAAVEKAIRLDPRNLDHYLATEGVAYSLLDRPEKSIPALNRFLATHPDIPWLHAFLAGDYSDLGDYDNARTEAAKVAQAVALDANSAFGYLPLADAMNSVGKPTEALAASEKAMHLDPGYDLYLIEQGRAYSELEKWQDAVTVLKRFVATHPDDFWCHLWLAVDYVELGHEDAARAEAAELLRINPTFSPKMLPTTVDRARFEADLHKAGLR
jgi:adenylate cyclase